MNSDNSTAEKANPQAVFVYHAMVTSIEEAYRPVFSDGGPRFKATLTAPEARLTITTDAPLQFGAAYDIVVKRVAE